MMRIRINSLLAALLVLAGGSAGLRAQPKAEDAQAPEFKEVYDLIRTHLAGTSDAQLNQAAVGALVSGLAPRVSLVTNAAAGSAAGEAPLVSKTTVFEGDILYVRVGRVGDGLANAISAACRKPGTTNKLKPIIVFCYSEIDLQEFRMFCFTRDIPAFGNGMLRILFIFMCKELCGYFVTCFYYFYCEIFRKENGSFGYPEISRIFQYAIYFVYIILINSV